MHKITLILLAGLISGCSMIGNDPDLADDKTSQAVTASCNNTYNDVDANCADSIRPETY